MEGVLTLPRPKYLTGLARDEAVRACYELLVPVDYTRGWEVALSRAGDTHKNDPIRKFQSPKQPERGKRNERLVLLSFAGFMGTKKIERWADRKGLKSAHPRMLLAVLEGQRSLRSRLAVDGWCSDELCVVSLAPTGLVGVAAQGPLVCAVRWQTETVTRRAVYVPYMLPCDGGWEPQYWFLFQRG